MAYIPPRAPVRALTPKIPSTMPVRINPRIIYATSTQTMMTTR